MLLFFFTTEAVTAKLSEYKQDKCRCQQQAFGLEAWPAPRPSLSFLTWSSGGLVAVLKERSSTFCKCRGYYVSSELLVWCRLPCEVIAEHLHILLMDTCRVFGSLSAYATQRICCYRCRGCCRQTCLNCVSPQDEIYDNFVQNGRFTIGTYHEVPRRINDLVTWLIWALVLCVPLFYYATNIFLNSSLTVKLAACATVVVG